MASLKGKAIRAFMKWRSSKVAHFRTHAIQNQKDTLKLLLHKASNTFLGKKYEFGQIQSYAEFKEQLPISTYEDLKPYFERTLKGEQNVFWPEKITWFAKSGGTTSDRSKLIPVSQSTLNTAHYRGAFDVMSQYSLNRPQTRVFDGKTIIISGSYSKYENVRMVNCGDISAIMVANQPGLADILRVPPKKIALLPDFEKKIALVAERCTREKITGLAGVPTWNIVLMEKILSHTGASDLSKIWPDMELYIHGGVNFEPFRNLFSEYLPLPQMEYLQVYNASEGFFAFQDVLASDDMLLATNHGIVYEFIPLANIHDKNPPTYCLEDIAIGVNYALVLTTNSGLWRYMIGDTIKFTSVEPYRIKVTGRVKFYINTFGEELSSEHTDLAIIEASRKTGAWVGDYTVGPKYMQSGKKGAHEWYIEFKKQPEDITQFIRILDLSLQKLNSDYEAKRYKNLAMELPIVHIATPQLFYKWFKIKNKMGAQAKVPKLSNDRIILDELMNLM